MKPLNLLSNYSSKKNWLIYYSTIFKKLIKVKWQLYFHLIKAKKYTFYSQTDTEIIANLLEENYKETSNVIDSIKKTIDMLNGTYGLVIIHKKDPRRLYCVRNGSPLLIGHNDEYCIITSEQSGFCKKVNRCT